MRASASRHFRGLIRQLCTTPGSGIPLQACWSPRITCYPAAVWTPLLCWQAGGAPVPAHADPASACGERQVAVAQVWPVCGWGPAA